MRGLRHPELNHSSWVNSPSFARSRIGSKRTAMRAETDDQLAAKPLSEFDRVGENQDMLPKDRFESCLDWWPACTVLSVGFVR
jgi:hypothetical protein